MIKISKLFLMISVAIILLALLVGGMLPFYLAYSMIFLLCFSSFYLLLVNKVTTLEFQIKNTILSVGDVEECLTMLKVGLPLPLPYVQIKTNSLMLGESEYDGKVVSITKDEDLWVKASIRFNTRGAYNPSNTEVTFFDLLKIITLQRTFFGEVGVKVYPRIFNINNMNFGGKDIYIECIDKNSANEDLYSVRDVRPYTEGDSLKKVHWKLSAKTDELYVKNPDRISGEEVILLVDLNKNNYNLDSESIYEEKICDTFLSMVFYLVKRGIGARLYINCLNDVEIMVNDKVDFFNLMEQMIEQKSDGENSFTEFLQKYFYRLNKYSEMVIFTGDIDEELFKTLSYYKNIGYKITVYYCKQENLEDYSRSLNGIGINTLDMLSIDGESIKWWE